MIEMTFLSTRAPDHPQRNFIMPKIDYSAICFNNNLWPFLYMRVATLSRTTLPKPWTVLALATLTLVLAGAASLDTDRSELTDLNSRCINLAMT